MQLVRIYKTHPWVPDMDSFRITGTLRGESTGHRWVDSPHRGTVKLNFHVFFDFSWTSCWTNSRVPSDLGRHAAHVTSLIKRSYLGFMFLFCNTSMSNPCQKSKTTSQSGLFTLVKKHQQYAHDVKLGDAKTSLKWVVLSSGNGWSSVRRQVIICTNAELIILIDPFGTSFS